MAALLTLLKLCAVWARAYAQLLEGLAWVCFIFLEVVPHVYSGNVYETRGWAVTVRVWETAILLLFPFSGSGALWLLALAGLLAWRLYRRRGLARRKKQLRSASGGGAERDLDV